ncbi:MAG: FHA domain-containing protein [Armatimonadota bacterium]
MWRLLGVEGIHAGRAIDFDEDYNTVGTGGMCDILLSDDKCMAERQGEFILRDGACFYRDLDLHCVSSVNGRESAEIVKIRHGDLVRIGSTLFRVERVKELPDLWTVTLANNERLRLAWLKDIRRQQVKYGMVEPRRSTLAVYTALALIALTVCAITLSLWRSGRW